MSRSRICVLVGSASVAAVLLASTPAEAAPTPGGPGTAITFPLPAALAVVGAVLLAVVMGVVLQRRRLAAGFVALTRQVARLGEPARRRRRIAERRRLSEWFAADGESVRRAYDTSREVAWAGHALRLDHAEAQVWMSPADALDQPWTQIDETRWHRPTTASATTQRVPRPDEPVDACLVRVGSDAEGIPTFVDLTRLDGVLSIVGDRATARDTLQNVLNEVARLHPGLPLVVLPTPDDLPVAVPAGLAQSSPPPVPPPVAEPPTPVRAVTGRQPVRGLVIATGTLDHPQTTALLAWCGRRGGGWTGLVCGDIGDGAHWRWHVDGAGNVDIPVLGTNLTVPA